MTRPQPNKYVAMSRQELLAELQRRDAEWEQGTGDVSVHREELRVQSEELRVQTEALSGKERELELALARYTDLYDSAPLGYVTLSNSGRIEEVNLTGADLLGAQRQFLLGTPFSRYIMPQDRRRFSAHLRQCRSGQDTVVSSLSLATLDGKLLPVQLTSRIALGPEGDSRLRTVITDVSERERVDAEIRRLNTDLEKRVAERTRELETANAALSAENAQRGEAERQLKSHAAALEGANRALHKAYEDARNADRARLESERWARMEAEKASQTKDNFLATLSHELRTPLNAILGWAQLMRNGKLPSGDMERALEIIDRNIRAQTRLVSDLLDMSRILSGKLSLELGNVDLNTTITSVLDSLRVSSENSGVRIVSDLDASISEIVADPNRIEQIVWNLVSNAIKFSDERGEVSVRSRRVESFVQVEVADQGIGIRPEFLPYIFDRFRQEDASKTRRHGGMGLGLSIVKHLVEAHGGKISAASGGEGEGTLFTVNLPLAGASESGQGHKTEHFVYTPETIRGLKILLVEDNADSRGLVARQLSELDAIVLEADSARDALRKFRNFLPDIIISDIGMPDQDGYDLIREIRSLEAGRSVPAIALTAFARPEDKEEAYRAGYEAHLGKPIDFNQVTRAIARLVKRPTAPHLGRPSQDSRPEAIREERPAALTVLVVDDSEDSAGYVSAALQCNGHRVLTAHDGTSALEICSGMHPDVVLLDISLPDMDGFEVAERLRGQPEMKTAVVAAVSGFVIERDHPQASHFDHFLQKPLDPDTLLSFVQKCRPRPGVS